MGKETTQTVADVCYDPEFFREKAAQALHWLAQTGDAGWRTAFEERAADALFDPWRIDPKMLVTDGVLQREEWECMSLAGEEDADAEEFRQNQEILLTMAYERSNISQNPDYQRFLLENKWWLEEHALFLALDRFFGGIHWQQWPEDIRRRYGYALDYYRRELYFDAEFQMYLQFLCFRQQKLAEAAGVLR